MILLMFASCFITTTNPLRMYVISDPLPSFSCSFPQPAMSWYTVQRTERTSDCCGQNCSPAEPTEPETGYSCRLYVVLPALKASARRSNMAPETEGNEGN